jgi:hypothetical protein
MGRPKLDRTVLQVRVDPDTPDKLKQMSLKLGFQWGDQGNTGKFLDAISSLPAEKIKQLFKEELG